MSDSSITVAVVSPRCRIADVEGNLRHFETWVARAAEQGADLVAFPELALSGYVHTPIVAEVAEPIPGPTTLALESIARAYAVCLSIGMMEKVGQDYYNAQIVVGPEGYQGHYRKHCPTPTEKETMLLSDGTGYPVFQVKGLCFGINICADSRQTETIDALAAQGVDLVHNPHANGLGLGADAEEWTRGKLVYYLERVQRCRAHMLVNNIAGTATYGASESMDYSSGAMILDPLGQVVARTTQRDREEKMLVATIDTDLRRYVPDFELKHLQRQTSLPVPRRLREALEEL